nr:retrovirus-related Pol polyprotein from transposon TNT 1-94 [Tanacetum cinerariifolium]
MDLKLREEHDIDKMLSMEKQLKFLNEIVYKRSQSIQTIHMMAPKVATYNGRPTISNPIYLKQAQSEIPCLYVFPYDQSNHANRLIPDGEETLALERESRSKLNKDLVRPYDYTKLNSLYEIFKPPTQELLPVSKSISKSRQAYNVMTNNINHFKQNIDDAWIKHSKDLFRAPTAHDMEILIQTCLMPLAIKTQSDSLKFVYELKQEMHVDLKYIESLEKEIDELESKKAEFSDMYDVILQECVSKDVMCSYLMSLSYLDALDELQCLYLHKVKECDCLAQKISKQTESVSKKVHTKLLQHFAKVEKHSISLEIALQICKEHVKNDTVCNEKASNFFRKEREQYFEIQDLKAKLQDKNIAISELKKLIEKGKGKSVDTNFNRPYVVRQPNAQRIPKPSVLGKPAPFSNSLDRIYFQKTKSVSKANVTKKPIVVPISTRKPKSQATKSIATPNKKKVASKSKPKKQWVPKAKTQWHMTGNLKLLCNFVEKFLGTVCFGNDQFAPILGYGDLVQRNVTINRVYYVEGLNHNLFSVGQFCDADLEVAFRKSTCFVRDLQGNDLLTGNRGSNLYTISLQESTLSTPLCLMAKATPTQKWLWHRRLSHLNLDYINLLLKKDIVIGLPKLKYVKDQLCSSCELSKAKRRSFKSKAVLCSKGRLNLLHIDLCGPMRVANVNGKKYILVIVDDYSRYTWTLFLCLKDETPEVLKEFLMMIQRNLQASMITVRTDKGTEFLNKTLNAFFKEEGIEHQTFTARTPKQNGVVERQNRYSTQSKGYRVYNKRTRMIVESIHIRFDEIKEMLETSVANNTSGLVPQRQKASDYNNLDPIPQRQYVSSSADADVPPQQELDLLFGPLYDEFFNAEEGEQLPDDDFTNPFCTPTQDVAESSSHNIAGSESRPSMLNKENYVPWSSRLLCYAKSRPNEKLIHNSIINGPYVRRIIPEPGDTNQEVPVNETFHEIWLRVQKMMKGSDIGIQKKKAKLFNEWERFTSNEGESIESYYHHFLKLMNDLKRNKHVPEKIASNLKFLNNLQPAWGRHVTITQDPLALMTNSNNPYAFLAPHQDQPSYNQNHMQQPMPNPEDITDPTTAMNMALALMAKAFKLNYSTPTNNNQRISSNPRNRQIAQLGMNMGQDRQMQMVGGNANQNENGNLVVARAEGNAAGQNGNQIRCYNYRGTDESAEVHDYEICDDNEIFNMFTQEEQYTELLEPIPEQHQVPQNDNNVISEVTSVEQSGETVEQHPVNFEETRALYDSLYHNLAIEVEKVN